MVITLRRALYLVAAVCFLITVIVALGHWHGQNASAWQAGGLLALALGLAMPGVRPAAAP